MGKENLLVGLDIGTTKIAVIISELQESGEPKIVGIGTSRSEGLKRGVVINLERTVESIAKAVEDAELMAGVKVNSVFAGIAGDHIRSINSRGVIAVSRSGNEIHPSDVQRVINAARTVALPVDREIIHVLPQEYTVDDQSGIKDPVGMAGVRLEAEVHIVTGAVTSAQNIYRSVKKSGLEVCDLVLQSLASSYALLSPEEQELGVTLIDLGGGTTDIAIFHDGSIRHTAVIGAGGKNVTNDIAIGLRTSVEQAEEIKRSYGCALSGLVNSDEMIQVPVVRGGEPKEISRSVLAAIIEPRAEEIFSLVLQEMKKTNYSDLLAAGVVLTGGGSLLEGTVELAEQIFDMPVRKGIPQGFSGLVDVVSTPIHSTGVGLILYGLEQLRDEKSTGGSEEKGWFRKMKNLFSQYF
ncbi:MAG: cell division protein FtsA [candidate division Zixibacteria bacterium SM1_73]|nr:MAG: cell division protein FtsA [candidate division Zixibacteria bacterium SM1_73]